jgi:hypothetical protein
MLGLFKKKTKVEKLQYQYQKLMKEAFELSASNRRLSDGKTAEANEIMKQIEKIV